MNLRSITLGILALVLFVAWLEPVDFNAAREEMARSLERSSGTEARQLYEAPDPGRGLETAGSIPVLAAPSIREALKEEHKRCNARGRQRTVVNWDGTIRCAALVPGIAWVPYVDEIHADRALKDHLKRLARKLP